MPVFDFSFTVDAPLHAVREFHRDTRALKLLTPPPTIIQLRDIEPMAEGSVSRFTLWVGPLPLRWTAVHHGVSEFGFTDIQTEGPALRWEHRHRFTPVTENRTKIEEHIEEHDPRNPATIADNVGDNVEDVAGRGADILESYVAWIVSAIVLAIFMKFADHGTMTEAQ